MENVALCFRVSVRSHSRTRAGLIVMVTAVPPLPRSAAQSSHTNRLTDNGALNLELIKADNYVIIQELFFGVLLYPIESNEWPLVTPGVSEYLYMNALKQRWYHSSPSPSCSPLVVLLAKVLSAANMVPQLWMDLQFLTNAHSPKLKSLCVGRWPAQVWYGSRRRTASFSVGKAGRVKGCCTALWSKQSCCWNLKRRDNKTRCSKSLQCPSHFKLRSPRRGRLKWGAIDHGKKWQITNIYSNNYYSMCWMEICFCFCSCWVGLQEQNSTRNWSLTCASSLLVWASPLSAAPQELPAGKQTTFLD